MGLLCFLAYAMQQNHVISIKNEVVSRGDGLVRAKIDIT